MHLFTLGEYEKNISGHWSDHMITDHHKCVFVFAKNDATVFFFINNKWQEICTLRGVSVCIASQQRKGHFFPTPNSAVSIMCVERPNRCCHWHDNCVHVSRGLCLNKDIAFGLADENVNESFRTFSVYSCRESLCIGRIHPVPYRKWMCFIRGVWSKMYETWEPSSFKSLNKATSQETEILPTHSYQQIYVRQIQNKIDRQKRKQRTSAIQPRQAYWHNGFFFISLNSIRVQMTCNDPCKISMYCPMILHGSIKIIP